VVIFDNLSSMSRGVDTNSNSDGEEIKLFFNDLKHDGYTPILVHHAGKGGDQRGDSAKEDLLDTTMKLEAPKEVRPGGAHFVVTFPKWRHTADKPEPTDVFLQADEHGVGQFATSAPAKLSADEVLIAIVDAAVPFLTIKAVAEKVGKSPSRVSRLGGELIEKRLVAKDDRDRPIATKAGKKEREALPF
jgi:hypothetical protein